MTPEASTPASSNVPTKPISPPDHASERPDQTDDQDHTAAMAAMETQYFRLFDLPSELAVQIVSELGYHDAASFRMICKAASELIPFRKGLLPKRTALKNSLSANERSEHHSRQHYWQNALIWSIAFPDSAQPGGPNEGINNLHDNRITRVDELNCYSCLRTLPRSEFQEGQTKGLRSLGHKEYTKRFCIDCGWRKRIWAPGSVTGRGARCVVICGYCGDLNREADTLFRQHRICGMKCWPKVLGSMDHPAEVDRNYKRVYEDKCTEEGRISGALGLGTPSRHVKCMRCWAKDHTERPRWSADSDFCLDCQVQLGIECMKLGEVREEAKSEV